jgi:hypothetical protein
MKKRRVLARRAAVVIASGIATATTLGSLGLAGAGAASAASSSPVVCTHLKGSAATDTGKLKGCPVASTGGKGAIVKLKPTGGKVTWANGSTTDYKTMAKSPAQGCPSGSETFKLNGSVTSSTNVSMPVGDVVKMTICLDLTNGDLTNAVGTTIDF